MSVIATPKKLAPRGDLIAVPRKEYEALTALRKTVEFTPTPAQKKALIKAERHLKSGKTLSYDELVRKLGFTS